jgi:Major Facilitator Superfamily
VEIASGHARAIIRDPDTRRLLLAQFLAQAADGFAQAVFAVVIVLGDTLEGTPARIFQLLALTLVPYSCISPFLGVFVDRWSRRAIMVWTNVARAGLLITLPLWAHAFPGDFGLYACLLLLLALGRLFLTSKGAALPLALHEHYLLQGNAISGGGGMVAALIGGTLGVAALNIGTPRELFAVAGALYGLSAIVAARLSWVFIQRSETATAMGHAVRGVLTGLREGLVVVWARPRVRLPLIGIFVVRAIGIIVAIVAIIVIRKELAAHLTDRANASAIALGSAGVGAFVAALSAPFVGRRLDKPRLILVGFLISGLGIVAFGGIVSLVAVVALTFVGGYGSFLTKVAVDAQVQEALPDDYRGRAFALYDILYNLASVVAGGVMVLLGNDATRIQMMTAGGVTLVVAGLLGAAMRGAGMLAPSPDSSPA